VRHRHFPIFFACAVFAAMLAWGSARPPGLSWDEAYYYPTFLDVSAWFGALLRDPIGALSSDGISAGWARIHELPPLVKILGAISILPQPSGPTTLAWMRVVPAAAFALTAGLLVALGGRFGSRRAGLLAAVLYVLHPHFAGNAQLAATEAVYVAVQMLAVWCALGDLSKLRTRLALAVVVGLALATKANALILVVGLAVWLLARETFRRGRPTPPRRAHLLALLTMLVVAPLVAFAIWPWMWHDTVARISEYARFVTQHAAYGVWYLGELRDPITNPVPPTYPWVMTLVLSPVLWLSLALPGALLGAWAVWRRKRMRADRFLLALLAGGALLAASLPSTPRYDGLRLFLPAFAPLVLFAAGALDGALRRKLRIRAGHISAFAGVLAFEAFLLFAPPFPLGYFNAPTLVLAEQGELFPFERTLWGEAVDAEVLAGLNTLLPPGGRLKTLALQEDAFRIEQRWGNLRSDIVVDGDPPYDFHIIQDRKGFWRRAEWTIVSTRAPIAVWHPAAGGELGLVRIYDGSPPSAPH
jgi:4-amino-4-deoxy-L-arabinose transferase-like glycosyltransferase